MEAPSLLKAWRAKRGLSQEEAAKLVWVHQNTWSDWENDHKAPRIEAALRIDVVTGGDCPVHAWADGEVRTEWLALRAAA